MADITFKKKLKIGLALSGGGALGLCHIGVLKVLEKNNIPIHMIAGNSIGGLIGASYSLTKNSRFLERKTYSSLQSPEFKDVGIDFFSGKGKHKILPVVQKLISYITGGSDLSLAAIGMHTISSEKIDKFLKTLIPDMDIEDLDIPVIIVAVDLYTGHKINLTKGPLRKAIQASISIPGFFHPVSWDDMLLVDGGLASFVPINSLVEVGCDVIIASVSSSKLNRIYFIENNLSHLLRIQDIMVSHIKKLELKRADVIIDSKIPEPEISWSSFDKAKMCIEFGEKAASEKLDEINEIFKAKTRFSLLKKLITRYLNP